VALGNKKDCQIVNLWMKSITNHLCWCVLSSNGVGELAYAKWISLMNHIINKHEEHDPLFQKCDHEALDDNQAKKEWFKPHSKAYCQLEEILLNKKLKKDIMNLSPCGQTYLAEGFHSLINHIAPKMFHFGYYGLLARLYIAALHFNENANRSQAVNKLGQLEYQLAYSRLEKANLLSSRLRFSHLQHTLISF
jgi:hypothetical protein